MLVTPSSRQSREEELRVCTMLISSAQLLSHVTLCQTCFNLLLDLIHRCTEISNVPALRRNVLSTSLLPSSEVQVILTKRPCWVLTNLDGLCLSASSTSFQI
jgi:hypothetical protein